MTREGFKGYANGKTSNFYNHSILSIALERKEKKQ